MEIVNDNTCSWVNDLNPRTNIKIISSDLNCEWLIIGAGYTGLSAARKLGQLYPNQKVLLVDAQLAGEGASSRNSGYLVDTTLNDGFTSNKELENYKKKADIYKIGIEAVKKFIKENLTQAVKDELEASERTENISHVEIEGSEGKALREFLDKIRDPLLLNNDQLEIGFPLRSIEIWPKVGFG